MQDQWLILRILSSCRICRQWSAKAKMFNIELTNLQYDQSVAHCLWPLQSASGSRGWLSAWPTSSSRGLRLLDSWAGKAQRLGRSHCAGCLWQGLPLSSGSSKRDHAIRQMLEDHIPGSVLRRRPLSSRQTGWVARALSTCLHAMQRWKATLMPVSWFDRWATSSQPLLSSPLMLS